MGQLYLNTVDELFDPERDCVSGPWCLIGTTYADREWERFAFVEPFESRTAMVRASRDCAELIRFLIGRLAADMDARHGPRPLAFWWTILTPWLQHLVEASWYHWVVAERLVAGSYADPSAFAVPDEPDGWAWAFEDTRDFIYRGVRTTDFVAWMTAHFLRSLAPSGWQRIPAPPIDVRRNRGQTVRPPEYSSGLKRAVRRLLPRLPVSNLHGISMSALPLSAFVALLPRRPSPDDFQGEVASEIPDTFPSGYLKALDTLMSQTMPRSFGAGFATLDHAAGKSRYFPRRLFVTAPTIFEDAGNFRIGRALEAGERVVRMQHGSEYGTADVNNVADLNEYIDAAFLTWGWKRQGDRRGRFVPVPSPMLSNIRNRHRRRTPDVILVGTAAILLPFRLMSWQQPARMFGYREDKLRFLRALAPDPRAALTYRPYRRGHTDLSDEDWLARSAGELRIHSGDLTADLLSCRLAVLDHPGTTLNLTLAANVPTVGYWNQDLVAYVPDAAPLFDALRAAGVIHDDPDSAAAHVNAIAGDVERWWNDAATQEARRAWVEAYARTRPLWWAHWLVALARI